MRRVIATVVLLLALPAAASAAPTPLAQADEVRVVGDRVLVAKAAGRTLTVVALPLAGGTPVTLLEYRAPARQTPSAELTGDPGVIVTNEKDGFLRRSITFRGTLDARWTAGKLNPGPPTPDEVSDVQVAGDVLAYAQVVGNEGIDNPPRRLVVKRLSTGEVLRDEVRSHGVLDMDLRADGSLILESDGNGLYVVPLSGPEQLVPGQEESRNPVWAGDRVVVTRSPGSFRQELAVLDLASATLTPFGVPTTEHDDVYATPDRVVWHANGCALSAPIDEPRSLSIPAGPCERSQAFPEGGRLLPGRRIAVVRVRCLSAPRVCRGTVSASEGGGRYAVPAGEVGETRVRLRRKLPRRRSVQFSLEERGGGAVGVVTVG